MSLKVDGGLAFGRYSAYLFHLAKLAEMVPQNGTLVQIGRHSLARYGRLAGGVFKDR